MLLLRDQVLPGCLVLCNSASITPPLHSFFGLPLNLPPFASDVWIILMIFSFPIPSTWPNYCSAPWSALSKKIRWFSSISLTKSCLTLPNHLILVSVRQHFIHIQYLYRLSISLRVEPMPGTCTKQVTNSPSDIFILLPQTELSLSILSSRSPRNCSVSHTMSHLCLHLWTSPHQRLHPSNFFLCHLSISCVISAHAISFRHVNQPFVPFVIWSFSHVFSHSPFLVLYNWYDVFDFGLFFNPCLSFRASQTIRFPTLVSPLLFVHFFSLFCFVLLI